MKNQYYHVCLTEMHFSISYSFLAKMAALSSVFLLSFTISVGSALQRGQRMLSAEMRSFMHLSQRMQCPHGRQTVSAGEFMQTTHY